MNFPHGYRYDEIARRLYTTTWIYGPFSSLFERLDTGSDEIRTVYSGNHHRFHRQTPMHSTIHFPRGYRSFTASPKARSHSTAGTCSRGEGTSMVLVSDIEVDPAEHARERVLGPS